MLAARVPTTIWARRAEIAENINHKHSNEAYLSGFELSPELRATNELEAAIRGASVIIMAVPSHGYRDVLAQAAAHIPEQTPIISLSKGIEAETLMRMTEVTFDVLPDHDPNVIGVMSGPNLANEIMAGQPAATVVAVANADVRRSVQHMITTSSFRAYTNRDVIGCESAGAVKNAMAIAAGMAAGKGFGDNTLATLVTRALVEMTRLGIAMGGEARTFSGLAGMGDLFATCSSSQSRNHKVGFGLGCGRDLQSIIDDMDMVAEGVKSTRGILALAERHGVEMPIAQGVGAVLYEGLDVAEALQRLMMREARSEFD